MTLDANEYRQVIVFLSNGNRAGGRISIYVMAMVKTRGGTAWGPPASPDRLDFLGKEGGLTGDRRDRTPIPNQMTT